MRWVKLGLWITLAAVAALLLRSARLGHVGAAFSLAVMGAVLLMVLRASPLRRAARELRTVARQLTDASPHVLIPTRLSSVDHLDKRYFEVTTRELLELGFVHLGDLEDRTLTEAQTLDGRVGRKLAVCLRAFRSRSGTSTALIAQLGAAEDGKRLLECATTWSDGRELVTNRSGRVGFDPPPYRRTQILPETTSTAELAELHGGVEILLMDAGATPVSIESLDAFTDAYNASVARAGLFRAGRGGVKLSELERVAGPDRRAVLEQVLSFMRIEGDVVEPPDAPES